MAQFAAISIDPNFPKETPEGLIMFYLSISVCVYKLYLSILSLLLSLSLSIYMIYIVICKHSQLGVLY